MAKTGWEHYPHPADVGIRGFGQSPDEAFVNAACALTAIIVDLENIKPINSVKIKCKDSNVDLLFNTWLSRLLYEMSTRDMLFSKFEVKIKGEHLTAKAWGEKVNRKKHHPTVEVKAATFTDLKVVKQNDGIWLAQCIVDV
jgi:tRNA nucleotidyltransferase (CCA-adding enzyme)